MRFPRICMLAVLTAFQTVPAIGQGDQRRTDESQKLPRAPAKNEQPLRPDTRPTSGDDFAPPQRSADSEFSSWLSGAEYQRLFDDNLRLRQYPEVVEGRSISGQRQFRARFVPFPGGSFLFWSHHGLPADRFSRRDTELRAQGFRLIARQSFDDAGGRTVQGTWVKP